MKISGFPSSLSVLGIAALSAAAATGQITGSAYFITNLPDGNNIVASNIGPDGKLTFAGATSAGGNGSKAINSLTTDPLNSSGSIRVSPTDNVLAVVNAGSNTVSLFEIDTESPSSLTRIGSPVSSGGEFPISLAFSDDGDQLCVLNGGAVNGVQCFNVNKQDGLSPIPGTLRLLGADVTTPPIGPFGTFSQLIFGPANKLIALKKGTSSEDPGFFAIWTISANGSLSTTAQMVTIPGPGYGPFSLTPIPGRAAFLSADASIGIDIFSISLLVFGATTTYDIEETTLPVSDQEAICWSTYSNQTGNYYVDDVVTGVITEIAVDSEIRPKPSIVNQYSLENITSVLDNAVGTISGQDYLYALSETSETIQVLRLNSPGNAEFWQSYSFASAANEAGIEIEDVYLAGMALYIV